MLLHELRVLYMFFFRCQYLLIIYRIRVIHQILSIQKLRESRCLRANFWQVSMSDYHKRCNFQFTCIWKKYHVMNKYKLFSPIQHFRSVISFFFNSFLFKFSGMAVYPLNEYINHWLFNVIFFLLSVIKPKMAFETS